MGKRVVLVALTCILFLAVCWVSLFSYVVVSGDSMLPTLKTGDFLVIDRGNKVQKGDIIVFSLSSKHKELVKRVIAEAGDMVEITASNIKVNGETIKEDYIKSNKSYSYDLMSETVVPANCIFVLGDNRAVSVDSRSAEVGMVNLNHFFDVLFNFCAGQHDLAATARAADPEIHAHAQHLKACSAAGVLFAGEDGISHCNVHKCIPPACTKWYRPYGRGTTPRIQI